MSVLTDVFPLLRGRTGIEVLKPDIPIVIRFYRGQMLIRTERLKVRSIVSKRGARIGVRPVNVGKVKNLYPHCDFVSYSLDYPLLDRVETTVEFHCEFPGPDYNLTLEPDPEFITFGDV